ncbi:MAG: recombinase family protein [Oscillospiraceae bacterium]|jgi:hypothetical protein|nr:recombinase family protein [Oscillospiraceae bacterium]
MKKSDAKIIAFYYRSAVKDEKRLEQWKKQIINDVKKNQIDNYKLYIDNGFSGGSMERPDLTQLVSDVKDGKIAAVIVTDPAQLSRNKAHHLKLEQLFKENGVNYFIGQNSDFVRPYQQDKGEVFADMIVEEKSNPKNLADIAHQVSCELQMELDTYRDMLFEILNQYIPAGEEGTDDPFTKDVDSLNLPDDVQKIYRLYKDIDAFEDTIITYN